MKRNPFGRQLVLLREPAGDSLQVLLKVTNLKCEANHAGRLLGVPALTQRPYVPNKTKPRKRPKGSLGLFAENQLVTLVHPWLKCVLLQ